VGIVSSEMLGRLQFFRAFNLIPLPEKFLWLNCVLRAAREVVFIERKTEDIFDKSRQQQLLKTGHVARELPGL